MPEILLVRTENRAHSTARPLQELWIAGSHSKGLSQRWISTMQRKKASHFHMPRICYLTEHHSAEAIQSTAPNTTASTTGDENDNKSKSRNNRPQQAISPTHFNLHTETGRTSGLTSRTGTDLKYSNAGARRRPDDFQTQERISPSPQRTTLKNSVRKARDTSSCGYGHSQIHTSGKKYAKPLRSKSRTGRENLTVLSKSISSLDKWKAYH
ncbi:hypothetical protein Aduo_015237 [Ancylostoma duodenale]